MKVVLFQNLEREKNNIFFHTRFKLLNKICRGTVISSLPSDILY